MLRVWFFLTVAHVIGFAIFVTFEVVYVLIFKGRVLRSEAFLAAFIIYLINYIFSLFGMWTLSALSQKNEFFYRIWSRPGFFRRALLSHGIAILMWVILGLSAIKSFSDLFLFMGEFTLLTLPVVLGLVIANWLMHAIAGLFQLKRKKEFFYRIWSRPGFFRRALLSQGIAILMWVILELDAIKSFSDLFLFMGKFTLLTSPVVLGLVIANWLRKNRNR